MARSAHTYVRGSTAKFYEWLEGGVPGTILIVLLVLWLLGALGEARV
jgi:hypothetical protein